MEVSRAKPFEEWSEVKVNLKVPVAG